jgi:hypothetical protein
MSFDLLRQQFTREHIWVVEIIQGENTWRFCENRAPLPFGLDAVPSLKSISISPTAVDLSGGLGVRASCSISLDDHIDYATGSRFWPLWRAQNPYYQGARLRVLSVYIDGETYSETNAQPREYILESWSYNRGSVSITAKDPLKLADSNRAQAPRATAITLTAPVTDSATSITVSSVTGWAVDDYLRIGEEVMQITSISAPVVGVLRGQYNTTAEGHSIDDSVQLCQYYNDTLPNILYDLLVNFAGVDPAFIPLSAWNDEASLWLPGLYEALITEPVGVQALIKELTEQAPHYLFWDERTNLINLVAIKQPPSDATCLDDDSNLIADSVRVQDKNDMRISRVIVHFGQFNPTKKLDEFSNYRQTFVRVDTDSETNYGSSKLRTIYSRWINNSNKAAAVRLAARIGRRFSTAPRAVTFALDAKDGDIWTGTPCQIKTADIVDNTGAEYCMPVQVVSAVEKEVYEYSALEHTYGPPVAEDADVDQPGKVVILSGEITNINLRTVFNSLFPDIAEEDEVIFIFDSACTIGSASLSEGVNTGAWPELDTPPLLDVRGLVLGKGGNGADVGGTPQSGGLALKLANDIRLSNTGIIGGGGGGGAYDESTEEGGSSAAGGGGAGWVVGIGGVGNVNNSSSSTFILPSNGSKTSGGSGAFIGFAVGGNGGGLGLSGGSTPTQSGGAAGAAIDRNGYTITYVNAGAGDIRGAII